MKVPIYKDLASMYKNVVIQHCILVRKTPIYASVLIHFFKLMCIYNLIITSINNYQQKKTNTLAPK